MIKNFLKSSVFLLMTLLVSTSSVLASAKMEVPLGELVSLQAEAFQGGKNYKWVVVKEGSILSNQSGSIFSYLFDTQGEYKVNLSAEDAFGRTQSTTVSIIAGDRYSKPPIGSTTGSGGLGLNSDIVSIDTGTLPAVDSESEVHILGDKGRVVFDITPHPDVLEYRIDHNIYVDSNGNGIANDDIDNASDSSYLLGGIYQAEYKASDSNKIVAEITAVSTSGKKIKRQIEIIFDSFLPSEGGIVATFDTLPLVNAEDSKIYVYDDKDTVAFYARRSEGLILEYRIDQNIFVDSDGDGDPANDIDNKNDASFKTGDVWLVEYLDADQQIIAQLTVVGEGGAGSRIQREIIFTNRPAPQVSIDVEPSDSAIALNADKTFVQRGDPISFSVDGLVQSIDNYTFHWDFNGDGEVDQTTEGLNVVSFIYDTPGIQNVMVRVVDKDSNEATFSKEMLVKDIDVTEANFSFEMDGKTVSFTSGSTVSASLSNKTLSYSWSFGDTSEENYKKQKGQIGLTNPVYTYVDPGSYLVSLTIVDSDQVTSTKTTELVVEGTVDEVVEKVVEAEKKSSGSLLGKIFKVILYAFLSVFVLAALIILGLLAFLKIQHPDLVFEELIDELKIKLLSIMGIHDEHEFEAPTSDENVSRVSENEVITPEPPMPEEKVASEPDTPPSAPIPEPEVDLSKSDGPVPDWMKPKSDAPDSKKDSEVIEGEVIEESSSPNEAQADAPDPKPPTNDEPVPDGEGLDKNDGPVPDWLKK